MNHSETIFPSVEQGSKNQELQPEVNIIKYPHELNRIDLQAIFEYLQFDSSLPPGIRSEWVKKHFTIHEDNLCRVMKYTRAPGVPPNPVDLAFKSTVLLKVLDFDILLQKAKNAHHDLAHSTVGTTLRHLLSQYWHPEITLATHQVIAECPNCQLMHRPDPTLPDLNPILPPTFNTMGD